MVRTRTSIAGKAPEQQSGFTYILVVVALVIVSIFAETAATLTSQKIKRDQEESLLFVGAAYQKAIESYYQVHKQYPKRLDYLVIDNRIAYKRHIRKLYADPVGNADWQLTLDVSGGITGVASSSTDAPLKKFGFSPGLEAFGNANHYSDWVFEYIPQHNIIK